METKKRKIDVYTDGACSGNPGPGGWGVVVVDDGHVSTYHGGDIETTNNKMELQAVIEAVKIIGEYSKGEEDGQLSAIIYTDSRYIVGGVNGWCKKWRCNGWKTAKGEPVKNREQWEELLETLKGRDIRILKVKGHAGQKYNEMADDIAVSKAQEVVVGYMPPVGDEAW